MYVRVGGSLEMPGGTSGSMADGDLGLSLIQQRMAAGVDAGAEALNDPGDSSGDCNRLGREGGEGKKDFM